MSEKRGIPTSFLLLAIGCSLLVGGFLGWLLYQQRYPYIYSRSLLNVMELVRHEYVDSVAMDELAEGLIPALLSSLDPHSDYFTAEESQREMDRLQGHFYGVGITFNTLIDTPVVVDVIPGGPAFRAGILAGDRILSADGVSLLSDTLNSESVQKMLRGERGSVVEMGLLRKGEPLSLGITRDDVPITSINVSYMLDNRSGLIRIAQWARNTHQEFLNAYAQLRNAGVQQLVIDLRDNAGGYMESAVLVVNEFLEKGDLIVYSEGYHLSREEYFADGTGLLQGIPLVVLINELSASSSEIFAAAIQDHDRGHIVGRRSFGKGLVQRPFFMPDGSEIRLTVARYYTPSGRSIQKEYTMGEANTYQRDIIDRYQRGEVYHIDSTALEDAPRFHTKGGRLVYGQVGVIPDYFVPAQEAINNSYYIRLLESGLMHEFTFKFSDAYREELSQFSSPITLWEHLQAKYEVPLLFANYAETKGIAKRTAQLWECYLLLDKVLSAQIAQFVMGESGFYQIFYSDDETIAKALEVIEAPPISEDPIGNEG